jgi:hypothetical protein
MLPLIVISILALAGMGGLIAVCMAQAKTNNRLANKVIANSDHQLQRIAIEEGADAYRAATAQARRGSVSYTAPEEIPPEVTGEFTVPARGG